MKTETKTITKDEYRKMKRDIDKLRALEAGGVDNWEWYDESLTGWHEENRLEELADEFVDSINDLSVDAEVDFPAGREAGPRIFMPENAVRELFLSFVAKAKETT